MSWLKRGSAQNGNNGKAPGTYNLDDLRADVVDKISVAVMMVDRDFNVTFVNEPTRQLLRTNAAAFRAVWPNFDPDRIVGSCIDMFHRNPSHQRNLLSDPSRLPYRAEISVGDLKFALLVNASFDRDRNYVGNVLEWNDVTAVRVNEFSDRGGSNETSSCTTVRNSTSPPKSPFRRSTSACTRFSRAEARAVTITVSTPSNQVGSISD